jgi:hypothetical protein
VNENSIYFPHLTQVASFGSVLLACHPIATEASENEHSWFLSDWGKHTEVKHLRAAAFADSNLGLLRITHARIIRLCDRHRCTKTVSQHEKQNRVLRIESSHDVSVQRPQHADARMQQRASIFRRHD